MICGGCSLVASRDVLDEHHTEDAVPVGNEPRIIAVAPGAERGGEHGGLPSGRVAELLRYLREPGCGLGRHARLVLRVGLAEVPDVVLVVVGSHLRLVETG